MKKIEKLIKWLQEKNVFIQLDETESNLSVEIPELLEEQEVVLRIKENKEDLILFLREINNSSNLKKLKDELKPLVPSEVGGYPIFHNQKKEYLRYLIMGRNGFTHDFMIPFQNLDRNVIEQTIRIMIVRHESLRTTFMKTDKGLEQVVRSPEEFEYSINSIDFEGVSNKEELVEEQASEHFDFTPNFETGPFFKLTTIVNYPNEPDYLAFSIHHVIFDETSLEILEKEIVEIYNAIKSEREPVLKPLTFQYKDYANWINHYLKGPMGEKSKDFYIKRIKNSIAKETDFNYNRTVKSSYKENLAKELKRALKNDQGWLEHAEAYGTLVNLYPDKGESYSVYVMPESFKELKTLFESEGKSLFTTLAAIISLCFYIKTDVPSTRIGIPFSTRVLKEFENVIGWLASEIIACIEINRNLTVRQFINEVEKVITETSNHRFYPHERLLNDLDLPLDLVCPIFLNLINNSNIEIDHFSEEYSKTEGRGHFNFTIDLREFKNSLKITIDYNPKAASKEEVKSLLDLMLYALNTLPNDLDCKINEYNKTISLI